MCPTLLALLPIFGPRFAEKKNSFGRIAKYWEYIFMLCVILVVFATYTGYQSAKHEIYRLSPLDFQLRLQSKVSTGAGIDFRNQPGQFDVLGTIKDLRLITKFELIKDSTSNIVDRWTAGYDDRFHGLAGIDEYRFDYYAGKTTVSGLGEYPFLQDLNRLEFVCHLPVRTIESFGKNWEHKIELFIMGRHFEGIADSTGAIKISIEM